MSPNTRFSLRIAAILVILLNGGLWFMLVRPEHIVYRVMEFGQASSQVPDGYSYTPVANTAWQGWQGTNSGKTRWLTLSRRLLQAEDDVRDMLQEQKFACLSVGPRFVFGAQKSGKSRRRYVYLFVKDNWLYWLETGAGNTSLIDIKHLADHLLTHLRAGGAPVLDDVAAIVKQTDNFVIPGYAQPGYYFLVLTNAVMGFVFSLVLATIHLSGRAPAGARAGKGLAHVSMRLGTGRKRTLLNGYVAVSGSNLQVYIFRRLRFTALLDTLDPEQVRTGYSRWFGSWYIVLPVRAELRVKGMDLEGDPSRLRLTLYADPVALSDLLQEAAFTGRDALLSRIHS